MFYLTKINKNYNRKNNNMKYFFKYNYMMFHFLVHLFFSYEYINLIKEKLL